VYPRLPLSSRHRQLIIFGILLGIQAILAFVADTWFIQAMLSPLPASASMTQLPLAPWQLGLANAAIVLVVYGGLGLIGYGFARNLGWPGIVHKGCTVACLAPRSAAHWPHVGDRNECVGSTLYSTWNQHRVHSSHLPTLSDRLRGSRYWRGDSFSPVYAGFLGLLPHTLLRLLDTEANHVLDGQCPGSIGLWSSAFADRDGSLSVDQSVEYSTSCVC